MDWNFERPGEDPWFKWAYEQKYGKGSYDRDILGKKVGDSTEQKSAISSDLNEYRLGSRFYWDHKNAFGVIQKNNKFVAVACLAAKEVPEAENYIRRFGLDFKKDFSWKGVSGLLEHLARSPLFKAVLVTSSNVPFKLERDTPERTQGRLDWATRNYNFHKAKVDSLKREIEGQAAVSQFGVSKPLKEQLSQEEINAARFMDKQIAIEANLQDATKVFHQIKDKLFTASLFFYVYTNEFDDINQACDEIVRKELAAKMEIVKSYFINLH